MKMLYVVSHKSCDASSHIPTNMGHWAGASRLGPSRTNKQHRLLQAGTFHDIHTELAQMDRKRERERVRSPVYLTTKEHPSKCTFQMVETDILGGQKAKFLEHRTGERKKPHLVFLLAKP